VSKSNTGQKSRYNINERSITDHAVLTTAVIIPLMTLYTTCAHWLTRLRDSNILHHIQSMLFAYNCLHCRQSFDGEEKLCADCRAQLDKIRIDPLHHCQRGGIALSAGSVCGECLTEKFGFDETIAVFNYKQPISQMINQYKFHAKLPLSELFAAELANVVQQSSSILPDVIVAVREAALQVTRLPGRTSEANARKGT